MNHSHSLLIMNLSHSWGNGPRFLPMPLLKDPRILNFLREINKSSFVGAPSHWILLQSITIQQCARIYQRPPISAREVILVSMHIRQKRFYITRWSIKLSCAAGMVQSWKKGSNRIWLKNWRCVKYLQICVLMLNQWLIWDQEIWFRDIRAFFLHPKLRRYHLAAVTIPLGALRALIIWTGIL